jgi:hypothetical protein
MIGRVKDVPRLERPGRNEAHMKRARLAVFLATSAIAACSTVKPVEAPPEELQRLITSENLLAPGDRVQLVTTDGSRHEFRVTSVNVDEGLIRGEDEAVPIADVIAAQTRKIAIGKTTALAAGLYFGIGVIIALALAPVILLSGF